MSRYLVTGNKGYIGSRLVDMLLDQGKSVNVFDINYFEDSCFDIEMRSDAIRSKRKDLRHLNEKDLEGIDTVFHLAALSNDPIGNLNSNWTNDINNYLTV